MDSRLRGNDEALFLKLPVGISTLSQRLSASARNNYRANRIGYAKVAENTFLQQTILVIHSPSVTLRSRTRAGMMGMLGSLHAAFYMPRFLNRQIASGSKSLVQHGRCRRVGFMSRWGPVASSPECAKHFGCGGETCPVCKHSKPGIRYLYPGGSRPETKVTAG
jgi:hypothetical protein